VSARSAIRDSRSDGGDDSANPQMILTLTTAGQLKVFADRFKGLQGIALNHTVLFVATQGRRDGGDDGVIFQIPILGDGSAGQPSTIGPTGKFEKPAGLVRDRLGALYLTADDFKRPSGDADGAVAKLRADGRVALFARNLKHPQGLAFDSAGNLYVTDAGRVLRFLAPQAPVLSPPAFTNQSPLTVTGTTEPNAEIDIFVNDATTPVMVSAGATGGF